VGTHPKGVLMIQDIQFVLAEENAAVPVRGTAGSAGLDLRSNMTCTIRKGKTVVNWYRC